MKIKQIINGVVISNALILQNINGMNKINESNIINENDAKKDVTNESYQCINFEKIINKNSVQSFLENLKEFEMVTKPRYEGNSNYIKYVELITFKRDLFIYILHNNGSVFEKNGSLLWKEKNNKTRANITAICSKNYFDFLALIDDKILMCGIGKCKDFRKYKSVYEGVKKFVKYKSDITYLINKSESFIMIQYTNSKAMTNRSFNISEKVYDAFAIPNNDQYILLIKKPSKDECNIFKTQLYDEITKKCHDFIDIKLWNNNECFPKIYSTDLIKFRDKSLLYISYGVKNNNFLNLTLIKKLPKYINDIENMNDYLKNESINTGNMIVKGVVNVPFFKKNNNSITEPYTKEDTDYLLIYNCRGNLPYRLGLFKLNFQNDKLNLNIIFDGNSIEINSNIVKIEILDNHIVICRANGSIYIGNFNKIIENLDIISPQLKP